MSHSQLDALISHIARALTDRYYTHLELILTTKCNLRCTYCFEKDADRSQVMSLDVGVKAINEFVRFDFAIPQDIVFFGGEPFLNWEVFSALVKHARTLQPDPLKLSLSTVTNGTVIPEESYQQLLENDVLMMVSLDIGEENHDKYRTSSQGRPTFNKVIKNIRTAIDRGVDVVVRSTIVPESVRDISDTYKMLKELGVSSWYLSRVTGVEWEESVIEELGEGLEKLIATYNNDRKLSKGHSMRVAQIDYMNRGVINKRCNAGVYNIAIDPNGNIFGCSRLATTSVSGGSLCLGKSGASVHRSNLNVLQRSIERSGCPAINFEETASYDVNSATERKVREMFGRFETSLGQTEIS